MLLPLLLLARVHRFCACVATPPGGPPIGGITTTPAPPTPSTPPRCNCRKDLYDTSLCPAQGQCHADENAVTYIFDTTCIATLNCPQDYFIRFLLGNGQFLNNIPVSLFTGQNHRLECINQIWLYFSSREAQGEEVQHLVCYERAVSSNYAARPKVKVRSSSYCRVCSSLGNSVADNCPQGYKCSEPVIGTATGSASGCKYSVIECPTSDLLVQLKSGSSMIIYPEDVICDGEWIFDDGRHSHLIGNMACLRKVARSETPSNCSCSYPGPRQICTSPAACSELTLENSLDGCASRIRCQGGNNLVIKTKLETGLLNAREQFVAGNNPLLLCNNGRWLLNNNDQEIQIEDNEIISCEDPTDR